MSLALKEAEKAFKKGEVPIGAVIVKNGKIISKAHNLKEKKKMVTRHAEIIAIEKANKKYRNWHLDECEIYVTLEPCMMCLGAIEQARIKKIIYSAESPKYGAVSNLKENSKIKIQKGVLEEKTIMLLQDFFKQKR